VPVALLRNGTDAQKGQLLMALQAGVPKSLHDQIALNRVLMRTGTGEVSITLNPDNETPASTVELAYQSCLAANLGPVERGVYRPSKRLGRIRVVGYGILKPLWAECGAMFDLYSKVNSVPIFHIPIPAEVFDLTLKPCHYIEIHVPTGPSEVRNLQMAATLASDLRHIIEVELWHPDGMHYYAIGDGGVDIEILKGKGSLQLSVG